MSVVLLGLGSRGDLVPLLALAREFRGRGRHVRVVALEEYASLVADSGAEHVPIRGGVEDAMWHPDPRVRRALLAVPPLMYLGMTARLGAAAPRVVDAVTRAVRPGDTVVAGLATAGIAAALAPRHRVVLALFAPVLPGSDPASTVMGSRLGGAPTLVSSGVGWALSAEMSGTAGRRLRRRVGAGSLPTALAATRLPILLAADPALVPLPADRPPGVRQTGFWTLSPEATPVLASGEPSPDDRPALPQPGRQGPTPADDRLAEFLAVGEAPVYVSFGTCPVVDPAADLALFAEAARRADVRIVVQPRSPVAAAGEVSAVLDDPRVLALGEMPHDRLFPRMAGVVHHGGAGTTSAAVAAGVPSAVVPHLGDQGYWGARVAALGLGPAPVPRRRLTARRLAGLLATLTGPESARMREAAREVSRRLRRDGVQQAADAIDALT